MGRKVRPFIWLLAAGGAVFAAAALWFFLPVNSTAVVRPGEVFVPSGATWSTLLDSLGRDGQKVRHVDAFRRAARIQGLEKGVKPGRYVLKEGMSYRAVAQMFARGLQTPVRLTFNNIRTPEALAGALSQKIEADSATLAALFTDPKFTENYGYEPSTFLAMFIPNTYEVWWNITPEGLCDRMRKEYSSFWTRERFEAADAVGLSPLQVSILASIVYEETKMSDEMPKVAGVYLNRLKIGMPLQADPTVKFAVGDPTIRRVLNRHLEVDSPYNTYKHAGLPPGPICMPSIRAIDAVLHPAKHNYLYFCAASDFSGYHRFAATLAEHARNAREYAAALSRQGIR